MFEPAAAAFPADHPEIKVRASLSLACERLPGHELIIYPKKGSAVWWPHGMEHNLWQKDDRTHHEAMPVIKGIKKAANYWIHGSDFKGSMAAGCDGRQKLKPRIWRMGDR